MAAAKRKPAARRSKPAERVDLDAIGIEAICDRIALGETQKGIAESLGVPESTMRTWIGASHDRVTRVKLARITSGQAYAEKAEAVLQALPKDATPAEITKARELASHYRWAAKAADPSRYGDRLAVDHGVQDADAAALRSEVMLMLGLAPAQAATETRH